MTARPSFSYFASVFVLLTFPANHANAQNLPLVAGDMTIAYEIAHTNTNLLIIGDSLQGTEQIATYLKQWRYNDYTSHFISPDFSSNLLGAGMFTSFDEPWIEASTRIAPDDRPWLDGYTPISPGRTSHVIFTDQPVPSSSNLLTNRFHALNINPLHHDSWTTENWLNNNDGNIYIDFTVYANPTGLDHGLQFNVRGDSIYDPLAQIEFSTYAPQPTLRTYSVAFPATGFEQSQSLSCGFRMIDNTTPTDQSNFIFLGARVSTGMPGLQLANIAQGGKGVAHFLNRDYATNENFNAFISSSDSNTTFIALGANDVSLYTPGQWKIEMENLITRLRDTRPGMQFVLLATYDTGPDILEQFTQALHEITLEQPNILFLNLYQLAGNYESLLHNHYPSDGTHPSTSGRQYFANQIWSMIELAAVDVLPGDFNGDCVVDQADYTFWADNLGPTNPDLSCDCNNDGIVDQADYTLWADDFGITDTNLPADGNDDGTVDQADYTLWADNFGEIGQNIPGDYNNDGLVDQADYTLWADCCAGVPPDMSSDFNNDRVVDQADYTTWADTFGNHTIDFHADSNRDGFVDHADYTLWADNFGNTYPANPDTPAVPEPTTITLITLTALTALKPRHNHNHK